MINYSLFFFWHSIMQHYSVNFHPSLIHTIIQIKSNNPNLYMRVHPIPVRSQLPFLLYHIKARNNECAFLTEEHLAELSPCYTKPQSRSLLPTPMLWAHVGITPFTHINRLNYFVRFDFPGLTLCQHRFSKAAVPHLPFKTCFLSVLISLLSSVRCIQ